jgi:hypothetical protein
MIAESGNWASALFGGFMLIAWILVACLVVAGVWMTFVKAGRPGWGAIIPFYNFYLMIKVAGHPGWWLILMFIPFVNFVILIIVCLGIAKNFGHGAGYGILLWLLPFIMFLVLGFGSDQYRPVNA